MIDTMWYLKERIRTETQCTKENFAKVLKDRECLFNALERAIMQRNSLMRKIDASLFNEAELQDNEYLRTFLSGERK